MPRLASLTSQILTGTGIKKDLSLVYTLDNPNPFGTSDTDLFGNKIGISDTHAIVGTYLEDEGVTTSSGKAYIYNLATGALVHTLDNPNPFDTTQSDYFGISVDIDGNYAVVGAYLEDEATGTASGKAYIFNVTTGALIHTLDNPNASGTVSSDYFGDGVAISGNYCIVGAWGEDDGANQTGTAYIFNVTTGALVHTIDNPTQDASDTFGRYLDIDGNYAIVGVPGEDQPTTSSGKAYIFNVTTGALVYTLDNPNTFYTAQDDFFGRAVAISGDRAIVSATGEDTAIFNNTGKVYIFDVTTGTRVRTITNPGSTTNSFGLEVDISGNRAIVSGDRQTDADGGTLSGQAYIFNITSGDLLQTLDNPNPFSTGAGDQFGAAVAITSNYAVVGAPGEDESDGTDSGKAYIFK
tara:strand:+ start:2214 stop:3440 length:1227 start_codon:yes stop_codon:yes gene_type:complete